MWRVDRGQSWEGVVLLYCLVLVGCEGVGPAKRDEVGFGKDLFWIKRGIGVRGVQLGLVGL